MGKRAKGHTTKSEMRKGKWYCRHLRFVGRERQDAPHRCSNHPRLLYILKEGRSCRKQKCLHKKNEGGKNDIKKKL